MKSGSERKKGGSKLKSSTPASRRAVKYNPKDMLTWGNEEIPF